MQYVGILSRVALTIFFLGLTEAYSQSADPDITSKLDNLFQEFDRTDSPGFGVGIIQNGKTLYRRGIGLANLETRTVFTPETVSDIGSVAKQLTCMGIVLLEQQGKLDLDDDIRLYFPDIPDFGSKVTIRQLMHHISGLREIYDVLALCGWQQGDGIHQRDAVDLVLHSSALNFPPGSRYAYCNTGYMLLGNLIAKVGGKDFEQWMRENIFLPLGMEDTYIMDKQGELFSNCAESYSRREGHWVKLYDNSTAFGQGGVYSTIPDMLKWLDNFRTGKVGGPAGLQQLSTRGILSSGDTLDYALGIEHAEYRGNQLLEHTGSSAGYRAILCYLPDYELGIMLKSNYSDFDGEALSRKILDLLLRLPPVPASAVAAAKSRQEPLPVQTPESYTGRFFSAELEQFFEIYLQENKLFFRSRNLAPVELEAVGPDRFRGRGFIDEIVIERDKKQKMTGIRVSLEGARGIWMEKWDKGQSR